MSVLRNLKPNCNNSVGLKQNNGMLKRFKNTKVPDLRVGCDVGAISVA
jgi:hypothetical protein